jgi:hypothetical protein
VLYGKPFCQEHWAKLPISRVIGNCPLFSAQPPRSPLPAFYVSFIKFLRMRTVPTLHKLFVALTLLGALPALILGQEPKAQIKSEIDRLQQSLREKPISSPDFPDINSAINASLNGAAEALDVGKFYLSLERLLQAEDLFLGARVAVDKADAVKSSFPAFEAEWEKASQNLKTLNDEAHKKDWRSSPLALRALSETAEGRSMPLLEGGRGFATSTKPSDGLFYTGQAQGEAYFAKFSSSLVLVGNSPSFPLRSYLPELQRLQERSNAAFTPPRSIELHSRFIALNSTLKLAEELDAQRLYAGALYQYLEATRHYGMLEALPLDAAQQSALKTDLAAVRKRLATSKQDDSLAQFFLERAESQIAHADGSAPSADEWRSARVILDQVLLAYYAALKPASPLQHAFGKTMDITLVRWPYT